MYSKEKKEREKQKGLCFINSKLANGLCYILSPVTQEFSLVKEKKKERYGL